MLHPSRNWGFILFLLASLAIIMACSVSTASPTQAPALDATKAVLEFQATTMALQLTQSALSAQQQVAAQPTDPPPPLPTSTDTPAAPAAPTQVPPTPTKDVEAQIKAAKVLVYENTDERGIGMWVQDALDGMGMKYTQTGSYSGHFMEYLDSGIKWDLIIVDAEDKDKISGEFWDVIYNRLSRDKTALIAEVWYLDREYAGPISKILGGCGVRYRTDLPVDDSIYWWTPDHEVFNEPNVVLPLIHVNQFWANQAGDKLLVGGSGDATMLAGLSARASSGEGVLASCYDGRVIVQTFSDHDYHQADIIPLWQNYIHYTLKNHFKALQ
jgi:hypothetical protein